MSNNPKEPVIDFTEEIAALESMLESEHPGVTHSRFYKGVKGFVRAKTAKEYVDILFKTVANPDLEIVTSKPVCGGDGCKCDSPKL